MKRERNCQLLSVRQTEREKEDEKTWYTINKYDAEENSLWCFLSDFLAQPKFQAKSVDSIQIILEQSLVAHESKPLVKPNSSQIRDLSF